MKKKRQPPPTAAPAPRLADLLRSQGLEVPERSAAAPTEDKPAPSASVAAIVGRTDKLQLRVERKGRRGKTVTLLEGLRGDEDELGRVAKALRKALGCGASLEGVTVVLQGKQVERARGWLQKQTGP